MNFHTFCIDGFFYLQVSSFLEISSASVQPDIPQSVLLHHEYNPDNCEVLFLFPHLSVPCKDKNHSVPGTSLHILLPFMIRDITVHRQLPVRFVRNLV